MSAVPISPPPAAPDASAYPRTYTRSLPWRILLLAVTGAVALGGLFGAGYYAVHLDSRHLGLDIAMLVTLVCLAALGAAGVHDVRVWRLVLLANAFEIRSALRTRLFARSAIEGWRSIASNGVVTLFFELNEPRGKRVRLELAFKPDDVFRAWLATIPNLDEIDARRVEAEVAADSALGASPEERLGRLAGARKIAVALNVATAAAGAWTLIHPRPPGPLVAVLATLPWLAFLIVGTSNGLFVLDGRASEPRPVLLVPAIGPGAMLMVLGMSVGKVVDWRQYLPAMTSIALVLIATALLVDRSARRVRVALLLLMLMLPYAYGVTALANTRLDRSPSHRFVARVLSKQTAAGRRPTPILTLAAWGPVRSTDVRVSRARFDATSVHDMVCIELRAGALGIHWWSLVSCGAGWETWLPVRAVGG